MTQTILEVSEGFLGLQFNYILLGSGVADKIKGQGNELFAKADYAKALERFNEAVEKCKDDEKDLKAVW